MKDDVGDGGVIWEWRLWSWPGVGDETLTSFSTGKGLCGDFLQCLGEGFGGVLFVFFGSVASLSR